MNTTRRGRRGTSVCGTLTAYPGPSYLVMFCLVAWLLGAEVVRTLTKLLSVGIWIWALESKDLVSSPAHSLNERHSDTSIFLLSHSIQLSCVLPYEVLRTLCGSIDRWADFVGSLGACLTAPACGIRAGSWGSCGEIVRERTANRGEWPCTQSTPRWQTVEKKGTLPCAAFLVGASPVPSHETL